MNRFKSFLFWVSLLFLGCAIYLISRSNLKMITVRDCESGTATAVAKLKELVEENFLNRQYYEVFGRSEKVPCIIVHYNTRYQVLLISNDPGSGWSYYLEATPQQLKMIAEKRSTLSQIVESLKTVPVDQRRNY